MDSSNNLSKEDVHDIELSHRYRLSLSSSPSQSSFRVLALLFYKLHERDDGNDGGSTTLLPPIALIPMSRSTDDGRTYIVGTNDEPGYMGGAICAERAAMVQLRFAPKSHSITKIVICTDSWDPISPGMLCREFLAGHGKQVPWDVPILSSGNQCDACGCRDADLFDSVGRSFNKCSGSSNAECDGQQDEPHQRHLHNHHHDLRILKTTLRDLYTYPSPYTRLSASQSVELGQRYTDGKIRCTNNQMKFDDTNDDLAQLLISKAQNVAISSLQTTNAKDNHPIQFGCAVCYDDDKQIETAFQSSGLEYGCTLDAVSQLATRIWQNHDLSSTTPKALVQVDQYGIVHAPFAPARAFLTEHGFGDCMVLVHTLLDDDVDGGVEGVDELKLQWIKAKDLAPNAPAWTNTL